MLAELSTLEQEELYKFYSVLARLLALGQVLSWDDAFAI